MKFIDLFILIFLSCSQYYDYNWHKIENLPAELISITGYSESYKIQDWIYNNI
jgi:hypothetical protein